MVMTGGMLFQQADTLDLIDMCRARGMPVVVGGPDVTSSPHRLCSARISAFSAKPKASSTNSSRPWDEGKREGTVRGAEISRSTSPRRRSRASICSSSSIICYIGVQFSRGCPFTCEFCDIIELYGRVPRTKTHAQMLAELEALYQLGYRGHVDFVDDNLIGNKKAIKAFLPVLEQLASRSATYPFEFSTEASLNLADDAELLAMLKQANFFAIFVGIESPDTDTLMAMRKKQNTRRSIAGERAQDLPRRHFRHGGLHRRLRHREGLGRRVR